MDIISQLNEVLRHREAEVAKVKQAIEVMRQSVTSPVPPPATPPSNVATARPQVQGTLPVRPPEPTPAPAPAPAPVPARPQPQKPNQQPPQARTQPDLRRPILLGYAIAKWLDYMGRPMTPRTIVDGLTKCGYEWASTMNVSDQCKAVRGSAIHYKKIFEGPNYHNGGRISLRENVDIERIPFRTNNNYVRMLGTTLPEKVAEVVNAHGGTITSVEVAKRIEANHPMVKPGSISSAVCTAVKKGLIQQIGLMPMVNSISRARISVLAPLGYVSPETGEQPDDEVERKSETQTTRDAVRSALEAAGYPMTTAGVTDLLISTGHNFRSSTEPRIIVSSALPNTQGVARIGFVQNGDAKKFVWALSNSQFAKQPWMEFVLNEEGNPVPRIPTNNGSHQ